MSSKSKRLVLRLQKEGRNHEGFDGNNTNDSMNFVPKMDRDNQIEDLISGRDRVLDKALSLARDP